jgi:MoxR-like ATPase
LKRCPGYTGTGYSQGQHDLEAGPTNFSPGKSQCRACYRAYAADWRASRRGSAPATTRRATYRGAAPITLPDFRAPALEALEDEVVSDEDLEGSESHEYRPMPDLVPTWASITRGVELGDHPDNLMFLGPSGCGKTEGARYLAALVGLPFFKVDAAAMTDPESWFGTREVIAEDGASVTTYRPSLFVQAIEQPSVLLIDEVNRVDDEHRNILLPLLDGTHRITNPLTGDMVIKHPMCFVVLAGNRGLQFTGTYAVDPALMTRCHVVEFEYADPTSEELIAKEATGCDDETAKLFVRFANESRERSKLDADFAPISTREVMKMARRVVTGLTPDLAAKIIVMNAASPEGGAQSVRAQLETIWAGIRNPAPAAPTTCGHKCPWDTDRSCVATPNHVDLEGSRHSDGTTTWT